MLSFSWPMQPEDFTSFTSAVIDEAVEFTAWCVFFALIVSYQVAFLARQAFKRIAQYIDLAKSNSELKILAGGVANDRWVCCTCVVFVRFSRTTSASIFKIHTFLS